MIYGFEAHVIRDESLHNKIRSILLNSSDVKAIRRLLYGSNCLLTGLVITGNCFDLALSSIHLRLIVFRAYTMAASNIQWMIFI